jgi:polo-like kinase 4
LKRIRLHEVIMHPFLMRKNQQVVTIDSGIMSHRSARSQSEERFKSHTPHTEQVVGSASMYRCFSSLSINQHSSSTPSSYHKPQSLLQLTPPEPAAKRIDVPALNSIRLQPTRHKTKSAILSILDEPPGEVVLEFVKHKAKYGEERVVDVCRISSDGLRIVLYQPNQGKGCKIAETPPELPTHGADHIYSYENLPERHWRKYLYAHRFIEMVRAKTPKVTFYSELAKCQLMENLEDFEMFLYKGGRVTKSGSSHEFHLQQHESTMSQERNVVQHAEKCYQHCVKIEQTMSLMSLDFPCFPIIIGRRPAEHQPAQESRKDNTFNNYISSSQTPIRTPKINMPSFNVEQTPSPSLRVPVLGLNNHRVPDTPLNHFSQRTAIPGIGSAVHLPSGTVEIQYFDGSQISALTPEQGGGILFSSSTGKGSQPIHYNENDMMPDVVRAKFKQLPVVLKHLMHRDGDIITSTPMHNPALLSNRLHHMKFIR